jgi:prepilin-type N-terminal cleavage/methylation domain-containing protein
MLIKLAMLPMLNPNNRNHRNNRNHPNPGGFTLIELILVLGLFGFLTALLMGNLFSINQFKEVVREKKDINFEASSVLNNALGGLIRSGFAINYAQTDSAKSHQPTEGMRDETDRISVFTDRAETQYFTVYREPYQATGDNTDTARLMVAFSTGEVFPLNTSDSVVEDFDVEVPPDPRTGDPDIQPYVTLYLRVRHRRPLEGTADENGLMAYQTARASYKTTYMLRNVQPSSNR